jgi:hypothetical protein
MKVKPNVWHALAFLIGAVAIIAGIVSPMIQSGTATVQGVLSAVAASGSLFWALALKTVLSSDDAPGDDKSQKRGFVRLRVASMVAATGALLVFATICSSLASGCGAISNEVKVIAPLFEQVAKIIISGLEAGKSFPDIEKDVAIALAGKTGLEIETIFNDVITALVDTGVIKPLLLPKAQELQGYVRGRVLELSKAGK